jgi:hypothetical protein
MGGWFMPIAFYLSHDTGHLTPDNVVHLYGDTDVYLRRGADQLGIDADALTEVNPYSLNQLADTHRDRLLTLLQRLHEELQQAWQDSEVPADIEAPRAMGLDEGFAEDALPCGREGILGLLDRLMALCRRSQAEHDALMARGE